MSDTSDTVKFVGTRRPSQTAVPTAAPCLVHIRDGELGARFRLGVRCVLGRDAAADVQIPTSDVSRRHAEVACLAPNQWVIRDLGSRNGTFINGIPTREGTIQYGDRIQLGVKTVLVFTLADPTEEQLARMQKMEAVAQIAAGVAHNFNNLLTVLMGNVSGLKARLEDFDDDDVAAALDDMEEATAHGAELIRELLGLARSDDMMAASQAIDLADLVEETMRLVDAALPRTIELVLDLEPEVRVAGDRSRLRQVLTNLVINARNAMERGGSLEIRVDTCEADPAFVGASAGGREAVISVRDSGIGMDAVTMSRIFEPFFTTRESGTGLGLASVWRTVRDHGGRVMVDSTPGEGTEFRVHLPLQLSAEKAREGTPFQRHGVPPREPGARTAERLETGRRHTPR